MAHASAASDARDSCVPMTDTVCPIGNPPIHVSSAAGRSSWSCFSQLWVGFGRSRKEGGGVVPAQKWWPTTSDGSIPSSGVPLEQKGQGGDRNKPTTACPKSRRLLISICFSCKFDHSPMAGRQLDNWAIKFHHTQQPATHPPGPLCPVPPVFTARRSIKYMDDRR